MQNKINAKINELQKELDADNIKLKQLQENENTYSSNTYNVLYSTTIKRINKLNFAINVLKSL